MSTMQAVTSNIEFTDQEYILLIILFTFLWLYTFSILSAIRMYLTRRRD